MKVIARAVSAVGLALVLASGSAAQEPRLQVVAAENFYGDIARQVGGNQVDVASIMNNPEQDPHLFEASPSVIRQVAGAQVVVFNGANYDPWMNKLLSASPRSGRTVLNVAELVGKKDGDNPHLWYDPSTMQAVAKALAVTFGKVDPAHAAYYTAREGVLDASLTHIKTKMDQIRAAHGGVAVTATEPVFGPMVAALGLEMRNGRFQLAVMNSSEPSARDIASFQQDLKEHKVKVLIYNKQASTPLTQRMLEIARQSNVPVVGVTETQPSGVNYQDWMLMQLHELQKALAASPK
jgi:zinc/manganese transport system substrate-binding protein